MADNYFADVQTLNTLTKLARQEPEFDLFYRRFAMADRLSKLAPEQLSQLPTQPWYREYWSLVGEHRRQTRFSVQEKNFYEQTLKMLKMESNALKRQCFALTLLMFGDLKTAYPMLDQNLLPTKLQSDLSTFMAWNSVLNDETVVGNVIADVSYGGGVVAAA